MRRCLALAAFGLVLEGYQRPEREPKFVRIEFLSERRTLRSTGPTVTQGDDWPYSTVALKGGGGRRDWSAGMGLGKDGHPNVEIRCADGDEGGVQVEMKFSGPPLKDLE